jgi:chromosome segregation ATPase
VSDFTPPVALFRAWREEIEKELVDTRNQLEIALTRVEYEERRLAKERRQREQLQMLLKRAAGAETIATALRVRVEVQLDECKAAVSPLRATIENLRYRLQDLSEALQQIDRALRIEEPAPAPAEAPPPPRGKAPEFYEPILMPTLPPPRGAA